jgi:hypothetical protein
MVPADEVSSASRRLARPDLKLDSRQICSSQRSLSGVLPPSGVKQHTISGSPRFFDLYLLTAFSYESLMRSVRTTFSGPSNLCLRSFRTWTQEITLGKFGSPATSIPKTLRGTWKSGENLDSSLSPQGKRSFSASFQLPWTHFSCTKMRRLIISQDCTQLVNP